MKKTVRIIAIVLLLACLFALTATIAFAATSKSGTNIVATVTTGKRPWYSLLNAKVTVKNTGNTPMTINVEDENGRLVSTLTNLKAGKSHTFTLKTNSTYRIYWSGNSLAGSWQARGTITAGRYVTDIR